MEVTAVDAFSKKNDSPRPRYIIEGEVIEKAGPFIIPFVPSVKAHWNPDNKLAPNVGLLLLLLLLLLLRPDLIDIAMAKPN